MNILALVRVALEALAAWLQTAAIRERATLRRELTHLRHEITTAANAGDPRLGGLQDQYADACADLEALRPTARDGSAERH